MKKAGWEKYVIDCIGNVELLRLCLAFTMAFFLYLFFFFFFKDKITFLKSTI